MNVIYAYNEILNSNGKLTITATLNNINESHKNNTDWKKPETKMCVL